MAEIPSEIASSAAQAGYQSREISADREARRAGQAHAAERQVRSIDEAGDIVETSDADSRVFADAEGGGGQGRADEGDHKTADEPHQPTPDSGISKDEQGHIHLDLQA